MQNAFSCQGWLNIQQAVESGLGTGKIRPTQVPGGFTVNQFTATDIRNETIDGLIESLNNWAAEKWGDDVTFSASGPYKEEWDEEYYILECDNFLPID